MTERGARVRIGERLTAAYISPDTTSSDGTVGVQPTLGADSVYHYGSIYAQPGTGSVGVDLARGGEFARGGFINANGDGDRFAFASEYGFEIGGRYDTIGPAGTIGDAAAGVAATGRSEDGAVTGEKAGAITGGGQASIYSDNGFASGDSHGQIDADGPGRYGVNSTPDNRVDSGATTNASARAQAGSSNLAASNASPIEATHMASATTSTLSSYAIVDFKDKTPVAIGKGFSYSLPKSLYYSKGDHYYGSPGGFYVKAKVSVAGGIKGGVTFTAPSILPDFALEINPDVLSYVQQGQTFTVDPTLIGTEDAGFSLNLPTATANLTFGALVQADVSVSLPSVTIGWSPFSYTFDGPSFGYNLSGGKLVSLPGSGTESFPGGYATISEITAATAQSTLVSQTNSSLPSISETFYTSPFLKASFDAVAAIAQYVPELKVIDGSEDFGVGSVNWSLLSAPMTASLALADKVTASGVGLSTYLSETVRGKKTDLGTKSIGSAWTLTAPTFSGSGDGVIALEETYVLTLNVQSALSLFGSFGLTLDGPQASASIIGYDFGFGPLFSVPIISESGEIAPLYTSKPTQVEITASQRELVFYGTSVAAATVTQSQQTSLDFGASGALLTIAKGVYISPSSGASHATVGVQATLGADGVYNYGSVYAQPGANSVGVDLAMGAKLVNHGDIGAKGPGFTHAGQVTVHYAGKIAYGVEIGGHYSTITNTGTISGAVTGIVATGGASDYLFVYNNASAAVVSGSKYGVISDTAQLVVHNDGEIDASSGVGVQAGSIGAQASVVGLSVYNDATGAITGGGMASVYSAGIGFSFVENQGQIGTGAGGPGRYGVDLMQGDVFNSGTIVGSSVGVRVGSSNLPSSSVYNAGLIEATPGSGAYAVQMMGPTNMLSIKPGASFVGAVSASGSATGNVIDLLSGAGMGEFDAFKYSNFGHIDIAAGASWLLQGGSTGFGDDTFAGLSSLDLIGFRGLGFQYGDSVTLNNTTGVLSLLNPGGTTIMTTNLEPGLNGARFNVFGTTDATYIREFTGAHFSDVVNRTIYGTTISLPSQIINANSYFGSTSGDGLTIAQDEGVEYESSIYPNRSFGLDLQPVTVASTVTSGSTTSVSHVVQPAILHNHGFIIGNQQGILLETTGTIYNELQISATGDGIQQTTGSSYAKIVNYGDNPAGGQAGSIYGQNGVVLGSAGSSLRTSAPSM